jgi:hypothetical protein
MSYGAIGGEITYFREIIVFRYILQTCSLVRFLRILYGFRDQNMSIVFTLYFEVQKKGGYVSKRKVPVDKCMLG